MESQKYSSCVRFWLQDEGNYFTPTGYYPIDLMAILHCQVTDVKMDQVSVMRC